MGGGLVPSPMYSHYAADGSGRDTYIRRDPVEVSGKNLYKAEPRLITRFGAAGSALPRDRHAGYGGFVEEEHYNVGGKSGKEEKPKRFLKVQEQSYPVEIHHYSTMKARRPAA